MNATNKELSIIAFYLSEYDMQAVMQLGFRTRTEAINTLSQNIGNGNNYLKLRRDEFDALPNSSSTRKGWRNRPPLKEVVDLAAYLHQFSFSELTDIVISLVNNHLSGGLTEEAATDQDSDSTSLTEEEIERIINSTDASARLVLDNRTGKHRVYDKSIIINLKRLYRGCCQICGCNPMAEYNTNICEAHHIQFFSDSQNNDASNIIIVCPNHHRLLHKLNPSYVAENKCFEFGQGETISIVLDYHLNKA